MALKPFTHLQPISLHLRPIVLAQAVFPLARLLADCDAALRREGVLPSQPGASLQIATPTHSSVRTLSMSRLQLLQNTENPILVSFQPKTFETALYSTPRTRC